MKRGLYIFGMLFGVCLIASCASSPYTIQHQNDSCVKSMESGYYVACDSMTVNINDEKFYIPADFSTDLSNIPKVAWGIMGKNQNGFLRAAMVHDWLNSMICRFTREEADLILYQMLRQEGMNPASASIVYYAVRLFGSSFFDKDYC